MHWRSVRRALQDWASTLGGIALRHEGRNPHANDAETSPHSPHSPHSAAAPTLLARQGARRVHVAEKPLG